MKINISELLKNEVACLKIEFNDKVKGLEETINGCNITENINFKGTLTKIKGILHLNGIIMFKYNIDCYRCLENINSSMSINISEDILDASRVSHSDDAFTYEGYYLDMDVILMNYIMINLPMRQLCSEECKGLCPTCGQNLNEGKCRCNRDEFINVQMEV